jgi:hypothetical protein
MSSLLKRRQEVDMKLRSLSSTAVMTTSTVAAFILSAILCTTTGCMKKEKYEKEIRTLNYLITITDTFTRDIDRAPNPISIRNVMFGFTKSIQGSKKEFLELEEKYGDFKIPGMDKKVPKELKSLYKQVYKTFKRMRIVLDGKLARFGRHDVVKKAWKDLKEILYYY